MLHLFRVDLTSDLNFYFTIVSQFPKKTPTATCEAGHHEKRPIPLLILNPPSLGLVMPSKVVFSTFTTFHFSIKMKNEKSDKKVQSKFLLVGVLAIPSALVQLENFME